MGEKRFSFATGNVFPPDQPPDFPQCPPILSGYSGQPGLIQKTLCSRSKTNRIRTTSKW